LEIRITDVTISTLYLVQTRLEFYWYREIK